MPQTREVVRLTVTRGDSEETFNDEGLELGSVSIQTFHSSLIAVLFVVLSCCGASGGRVCAVMGNISIEAG
jgi:hypothetical protein